MSQSNSSISSQNLYVCLPEEDDLDEEVDAVEAGVVVVEEVVAREVSASTVGSLTGATGLLACDTSDVIIEFVRLLGSCLVLVVVSFSSFFWPEQVGEVVDESAELCTLVLLLLA